MAWTAPKTWSVGDVLTAADMNAYVRDNTKWLGTDKPAARAYRSTSFSHNSSGNWLSIALDSERADTGSTGLHSTSSNTERMTVPTGGGGWYLATGHISWDSDTVGDRLVGIEVNGTNGGGTFVAQDRAAGAAVGSRQSVAAVFRLVAGDYFVLSAFQNSGGTRTISSTAQYTAELAAVWLGT